MIKYLFIAMIFSTYTYAQDTIHLSEVRVNKTYKKPKIKTFLVGKHKDAIYLSMTLNFGNSYFCLVETHFGEIKQLGLTFGMSAAYNSDDTENFKAHAVDTEYAVTLYKNDNGSPGAIFNSEAIMILFEGSRAWEVTKKIDVSGINIVDNSFFIQLTRLTSPIDREKSYYVPICFESEKKCFFQVGENPGEIKVPGMNKALMVEVKMLTQDY